MRTAKIAFVALTALALLFPPWQFGRFTAKGTQWSYAGYSFLFSPPERMYEEYPTKVMKVDTTAAPSIATVQLATEIVVAAALTFGVAWALGKKAQ